MSKPIPAGANHETQIDYWMKRAEAAEKELTETCGCGHSRSEFCAPAKETR